MLSSAASQLLLSRPGPLKRTMKETPKETKSMNRSRMK
jgi:hypothetical protein